MIKGEFSFKFQTPEMLFVYRDKILPEKPKIPIFTEFSKIYAFSGLIEKKHPKRKKVKKDGE